MKYLISVLAPDMLREYLDPVGRILTRDEAERQPFIGNEATAGEEAHRRAKLWSVRYDCHVRGLEITPLPA